ncbi:hypothetical protein N665_9033s0001 [Sinapis alba]|nr:hypothetical protein N665_9033s0001 [Sinapis alba]
MADLINISVRTGHFSRTDGTSPDSPCKATLPVTIPRRVFKSSAKDSTRRSVLLLRVGNQAAGTCVASSPDSDLEAFSHNPAHGSFAPLAFQPSAMTNCANQRFLSY